MTPKIYQQHKWIYDGPGLFKCLLSTKQLFYIVGTDDMADTMASENDEFRSGMNQSTCAYGLLIDF